MNIRNVLLACVGLVSISYGSMDEKMHVGGDGTFVLVSMASAKKYCANVLGRFSGELETHYYYKVMPKYWKCFVKTACGYALVYGKICIGDIDPKHEGRILYKADDGIGYGVIKGSINLQTKNLVDTVIRQSTSKIVEEGEEEVSKEKIVEAIVKCVGEQCCTHIIDDAGYLFNNSAINEFYDAANRVRNGEDAVNSDGSGIENLHNSICGIMDALAVKGCCTTTYLGDDKKHKKFYIDLAAVLAEKLD